ncbi:insulinase family protein [Candidatus Sumerlaeota bacterium]|nr:insulinase family protein [Candidatus Sumerlaeota bacterium]
MNRHTALPLIALLLAACATVPIPDIHLDPDSLAPAAPLTFEPPEVERVVMDNGLIVFLLEDHELPLLEVRTITRTGSIWDPPESVGLAGIAGTVMRTGGTSSMTGDELDDELEFMAASIETGVGLESGTASLSCLMRDADRCMELFADVLRDPAFRQEKIDLALNQTREGIRRRNDDPMELCRREFRWLVFGKDNPWVRLESMESLDTITQESLLAFHERWYHPNLTMMAVAGDFERDEMLALIDRHLGDWERVEVEIPAIPPAPEEVPAGIHFIHRPDVNQSNIRIGHLGLTRHDPDEYAVKVMNFIYGQSGFTSRLMREVRSNRGLTYGIGGGLTEGTTRGFYYLVTFTKSETTGEIIDVSLEVTRDFQESPPTPEELRLAQESEANSFVFQFDSSIAIANQRMTLEHFGYPDDYLETHLDHIQAVTAEDVQRVAAAHIDLDDVVILVVGNEEEIGDQLEQFGEVNRVPLLDFATGEQIWP